MSVHPVLCPDNPNAPDLGLVVNEHDDFILVTLGVAVLERIRCDREALQYKMFIGRLVNAGWRLNQLHEIFGHDHRTMKRWAAALTSDDVEFVVQAFNGRGAAGKVTAPIIRFVTERYRTLRRTRQDYRQVIADEVRQYFGESLSRETLRKLFRQADRVHPRIPEESINVMSGDGTSNWASACPATQGEAAEDDNHSPNPAAEDALPFLQEHTSERPAGLHHLGLVLFAMWFQIFCRGRGKAIGWQTQWVGQILQDAVNIEQSRLISMQDLAWFTGPVTACIDAQRRALHEQATPEAVLDIYRANTRLLPDGPGQDRVFYYDPHSKEYTGQLKLLKDWCGRRHGVAKVMHLDMIHTRSGRCCLAQPYSPYYDLRERFFMTMELFDQLFVAGQPGDRLFVLDRGIYGLQTFHRFLDQGDHVLTWEKGYAHDGWIDEAPVIHFSRTRPRNHADDLRRYRFACQESPWRRDSRLRRIVVRGTNPKNRTVEVSVLCSCRRISVEEAVWLIFNRWLQENGFKYLDKHFGLNQLTSYASTTFEKRRNSFQDQSVHSPEYKELKAEKTNLELRLSKLLLKRERSRDTLTDLQRQSAGLQKEGDRCLDRLKARLAFLQGTSDSTPRTDPLQQAVTLARRAGDLQRKQKRARAKLEKVELAILPLKAADADLDKRLAVALCHQSRLQLLIDENYALLDTRAKSMLDALRIVAANLFACCVEQFRPLYGNYRNDHVMLRQLTRSGGFIHREGEVLHVRLWLKGTYQDWQLKAFDRFFALLSAQFNEYFRWPRPTRLRIGLLEQRPEL